MKGVFDILVAALFVTMLGIFLFLGPDILKINLLQQYAANILPLTSQDALLAILSVTNFDSLTDKDKITLEILGENKVLGNSIDFSAEDLENIIKSKCYSLEVGATKVEKPCKGLTTSKNKAEYKIVLPYNTDKLVEKIKLVIK